MKTRTFRKYGTEMPITLVEAHDVAHQLTTLALAAPAGSLLGGDEIEVFPAVSYNKDSSSFALYVAGRKFSVIVKAA